MSESNSNAASGGGSTPPPSGAAKINTAVADIALNEVVASATVVSRINFAALHLLNAATFARELNTLSGANVGAECGPVAEDFIRLGTAVVLLSVSAGECYLNERFADAQDVMDGSPGADPVKAFAASQLPLWTREKKLIARRGFMYKADAFLEMRGKAKMDRTNVVWLNFDALRELRNALHHFSPEWRNFETEHRRLSAKVAGRFAPWQWWNGSEGIFPNAWASHSCAEWAVRSARDFINLHSTLTGLPTPLMAAFDERLKTS
jgi:hypothetical protein